MRALPVAGQPEFTQGVVFSALAYGGVFALALFWGSCREVLRRHAGVALVLAALVALEVEGMATVQLVCGTALIAVAGSVRANTSARKVIALLLVVPGALFVALDPRLDDERGLQIAVAMTIVLVAPAMADYDKRNATHALGPLAFFISVAGLYVAVPDTEAPLVLLGACVPAVLAALGPRLSLGAEGAPAALGLYAWAAAFGARGRPAAMIGAIAALGVVLIEPLSRRVWRKHNGIVGLVHHRSRRFSTAFALVPHAVVALIASRVVAMADLVGAIIGAVALSCCALIVLALTTGDAGRSEPCDGDGAGDVPRR